MNVENPWLALASCLASKRHKFGMGAPDVPLRLVLVHPHSVLHDRVHVRRATGAAPRAALAPLHALAAHRRGHHRRAVPAEHAGAAGASRQESSMRQSSHRSLVKCGPRERGHLRTTQATHTRCDGRLPPSIRMPCEISLRPSISFSLAILSPACSRRFFTRTLYAG